MILPLTLRASSLDRIFSCHGSLLVADLVPPRPESPEADEGTAVHYEIASRAVAELGAVPPEEGLGPAPKHALNAFAKWIPDWALGVIKDTVPQDWALMVEAGFAYKYTLPRPVWVPLSEISGPIPEDHEVKDGMVRIAYVIISGHMDVLAISPDGLEAIIGDWKAGLVGADAAEENWQVSGGYVGLIKQAYPSVQRIRAFLAQPRIDEEATGIPRISVTTLEGPQLDAMNATLAEQANLALEDRHTTDSSPKACRWCPLALSDRACHCPSLNAELEFMKANLTKESLAAIAATPNDAALGDFVLSGRTLAAPVKAATDLLHERIKEQGYVDTGSGKRITVKVTAGDISIPDKTAFRQKVEDVLPEREFQDQCISWSKGALIDAIAEARGIHKESKAHTSAKDVWTAHLAPLVVQGERRILVVS